MASSRAALALIMQMQGDAEAQRSAKAVQGTLHDLGSAAKSAASFVKTALATAGGFIAAQLGLQAWKSTLGDLLPAARAQRDAVSGSDESWRICGRLTSGDLVTAWTDAPNGPLPPPDGGAE